MFSHALSEPEVGLDAASMRTKAVRDGDDWVLNGNKRWITNAGVSKYHTVLATTDPGTGPKGITGFVVHADDEGFTLGAEENKLGIKGSPTRELYFDNVRLPADRIIGAPGEGWTIAMKTLDITWVTIGAQAVGMAQGLSTRRWPTRRSDASSARPSRTSRDCSSCWPTWPCRSRPPASSSTTLQRPAIVAIPTSPSLGSAAKCFASDTAMKVTVDCVQVLGGYGYVKDYPVERFPRDAKITQIYEGTNQIQRLVMARQLLAERAPADPPGRSAPPPRQLVT